MREEPTQRIDRRIIEQQASIQFSTITSLLAGFAFLWFTTLITATKSDLLFYCIFLETAITIFVLLIASILGVLLTVASEISPRDGALRSYETLWGWTTKFGILLFLANVALLPYLVNLYLGLICSFIAVISALIIFVAWEQIKRSI